MDGIRSEPKYRSNPSGILASHRPPITPLSLSRIIPEKKIKLTKEAKKEKKEKRRREKQLLRGEQFSINSHSDIDSVNTSQTTWSENILESLESLSTKQDFLQALSVIKIQEETLRKDAKSFYEQQIEMLLEELTLSTLNRVALEERAGVHLVSTSRHRVVASISYGAVAYHTLESKLYFLYMRDNCLIMYADEQCVKPVSILVGDMNNVMVSKTRMNDIVLSCSKTGVQWEISKPEDMSIEVMLLTALRQVETNPSVFEKDINAVCASDIMASLSQPFELDAASDSKELNVAHEITVASDRLATLLEGTSFTSLRLMEICRNSVERNATQVENERLQERVFELEDMLEKSSKELDNLKTSAREEVLLLREKYKTEVTSFSSK